MTHFRTAALMMAVALCLMSVVVADTLTARIDASENNRPHWSLITQSQCLSEGGRMDLWIHNIGEEALQLRGGPTVKLGDEWLSSLYLDYWPESGDVAINPEVTYLNRVGDWRIFSNVGLVIPFGNDRPQVLASPETYAMKSLGNGWGAGISLRWLLKEGGGQFNSGLCIEKRDNGGCWYGRIHFLGSDNVGTEARLQRSFNVNF